MRLRLFGLMVLRGSTFGTVSPFLSVLLLGAGLPLVLLGPLSGVGAVTTLVAAPWWGRRGDRLGRRRMFALAMALTAPVLLVFAFPSLAAMLVASLLWSALSAAFIPLGDSLTLDRLGGSRSDYARLRVGASTGYMLTVVAVGLLVSHSPLGWAAPGVVGMGLALGTASLLAIHLGPELRSGRGVAWQPSGDTATPGFVPLPSVAAQVRHYAVFLGGMVLMFAAINAPYVFVGPRIADLGGDGLEIALAIAAGTVFEVPAFLAIGTVLRVLGTRGTFALGIAMLTVSGVYSAVVPEPSLVILGRLLSGSGYAWTVLPTMAAMAAAGGPRERAALTSLHYASSAVGSLAIALVGLPLVEAGEGSGAILVVTALLAPIGALLAIVRWPAPYQARPEPVASTAV